MFVTLLPLAILFLGERAASCTPPNGTAQAVNWWPCGSNDVIKYYNLTLKDKEGQKVYPIKFKEPFIVDAEIDNTNGALDDLKTKVKVWQWTGRNENCNWKEIPTLGLLNNLIQCGKGINCPIEPGKQNLEITVDLSALSFAAAFLPKESPYKIQYEIISKNMEPGSCLTIEALVQTT